MLRLPHDFTFAEASLLSHSAKQYVGLFEQYVLS